MPADTLANLTSALPIYSSLAVRLHAGLQPGSYGVDCVGGLGLATCVVLCMVTDEIGYTVRLVLHACQAFP